MTFKVPSNLKHSIIIQFYGNLAFPEICSKSCVTSLNLSNNTDMNFKNYDNPALWTEVFLIQLNGGKERILSTMFLHLKVFSRWPKQFCGFSVCLFACLVGFGGDCCLFACFNWGVSWRSYNDTLFCFCSQDFHMRYPSI